MPFIFNKGSPNDGKDLAWPRTFTTSDAPPFRRSRSGGHLPAGEKDFAVDRHEMNPTLSRRDGRVSKDWDATKHQKQPKTYRGVWVRFAEYTSLQGVPFINRANRWYSKLFWTLVLIAAFSAMVSQTYDICNKFFLRETTTSVKIGYDKLEFPSITICNINPLRQSMMHNFTSEMQEFLKSLKPRSDYRKRGGPGQNGGPGSNVGPGQGGPGSQIGQRQGGPGSQGGQGQGGAGSHGMQGQGGPGSNGWQGQSGPGSKDAQGQGEPGSQRGPGHGGPGSQFWQEQGGPGSNGWQGQGGHESQGAHGQGGPESRGGQGQGGHDSQGWQGQGGPGSQGGQGQGGPGSQGGQRQEGPGSQGVQGQGESGSTNWQRQGTPETEGGPRQGGPGSQGEQGQGGPGSQGGQGQGGPGSQGEQGQGGLGSQEGQIQGGPGSQSAPGQDGPGFRSGSGQDGAGTHSGSAQGGSGLKNMPLPRGPESQSGSVTGGPALKRGSRQDRSDFQSESSQGGSDSHSGSAQGGSDSHSGSAQGGSDSHSGSAQGGSHSHSGSAQGGSDSQSGQGKSRPGSQSRSIKGPKLKHGAGQGGSGSLTEGAQSAPSPADQLSDGTFPDKKRNNQTIRPIVKRQTSGPEAPRPSLISLSDPDNVPMKDPQPINPTPSPDGGGSGGRRPGESPAPQDPGEPRRRPRYRPPPRVQNTDDFGEGNVTNALKERQTFYTLEANMTNEERVLFGHQLDEMLLDCSFNGRECQASDFTSFLTADYGNCYTYNTADNLQTSGSVRLSSMRSQRSGANYGLNLLIQIQNNEYLKGLTVGKGIRVAIHAFNTTPFVVENGISVAPGTKTFIGMRMVKMQRLGTPYEPCGDNGNYSSYFNRTYTIEGCVNTCLDRTIYSRCGCYRLEHKQYYNWETLLDSHPCESTDESLCVEDFLKQFEKASLDCTCRQACKAFEYELEISHNYWPDNAVWFLLVDEVCQVDEEGCEKLKSDLQSLSEQYTNRQGEHEDDLGAKIAQADILTKNFLVLNIYYRDLNYETITEKPEYDEDQFLADFGGVIGLWIGATFITAVELMDLFVQMLVHCCRRPKQSSTGSDSGKNTNNNAKRQRRREPSEGSTWFLKRTQSQESQKTSDIGKHMPQSSYSTGELTGLGNRGAYRSYDTKYGQGWSGEGISFSRRF